MDFQLINFKLISHPLNWAIVWVTLALASLAYVAIHDGLVKGSSGNDPSITPD